MDGDNIKTLITSCKLAERSLLCNSVFTVSYNISVLQKTRNRQEIEFTAESRVLLPGEWEDIGAAALVEKLEAA